MFCTLSKVPVERLTHPKISNTPNLRPENHGYPAFRMCEDCRVQHGVANVIFDTFKKTMFAYLFAAERLRFARVDHRLQTSLLM